MCPKHNLIEVRSEEICLFKAIMNKEYFVLRVTLSSLSFQL